MRCRRSAARARAVALAGALMLTLVLTLASCDHANSPEAVVTQLYAGYLENRIEGVPTAAQQDAIAPIMSARLLALIADARAKSEALARQHPDEKPPLVEGCLFASLFEGPKGFEIVRSERLSDGAIKIVVHFWYERGSAEWDDAVVVVRDGDRFVIDDVLLSGAGEFNPPGKLSEILAVRED